MLSKDIYTLLARDGLRSASVVLAIVLVVSLDRWLFKGDQQAVPHILSACQGIAFIAVSVLGHYAHQHGR